MASVGTAGLLLLNQMLGARNTPALSQFENAWERSEGGTAGYNPFNTTEDAQGATDYNSDGVKNYGSLKSGLAATVATLTNGHYAKLVSDMRSGKASAMQLAQDVAASPWGTGSLVEKVLGGPVSPVPAAKGSSTGGTTSTIGAQPSGSSTSAPMAALMQMLMASNDAISDGESPDVGTSLGILQALQDGQFGSLTSQPASPSTGTAGAQKGSQALPAVSGAKAQQSVVSVAHSMLGTPYVWGGNTPGKALDCSGFIQQAYAKIGVNLPRTTYQQVKVGKAVTLQNLQPGDAVFVEPTKAGPAHVGMYIGNGQIQESPHTGEDNKTIPLKSFLQDGFVAARRYV